MVSGSGVRRQNSNGGVVIEDGLNTAKIVNIKSNLRPVASNIFANPNNKGMLYGHRYATRICNIAT